MTQSLDDIAAEWANNGSDSNPFESPIDWSPPPSWSEETRERDQVDTFIKLVIGTGLVGVEELGVYLQQWEEAAREHAEDPSDFREETKAALVRYALLGTFFELKDKVQLGAKNLGAALNNTGKTISDKTQPLTDSRFFAPVRNQYDALVASGEAKLTPLIERGRREDPATRRLARQALDQTIEELIDFLAENEEITDLIQQQSIGMAGEVVEDMRTRTVAADNVLERFARNFLRRDPREVLPPPPPEVQAQALHIDRQADLEE